jgi:hypothetical protein
MMHRAQDEVGEGWEGLLEAHAMTICFIVAVQTIQLHAQCAKSN